MATDACIRHGLELAKFRDYTKKSLQFQMPMVGSIKNPVDVIGDARHDRYRAALDAVTADDQVDQVLVIVTPQTMTDVTEIAEVIGETKEFCNKPMAACLMGLVDVSSGRGYPAAQVRRADVCLSRKRHAGPGGQGAIRPMGPLGDQGLPGSSRSTRRASRQLFERELAEGRPNLIELKALEALELYGFPTVPYKLAKRPTKRSRRPRRWAIRWS